MEPGRRATWKALTIVFPHAKESGSTSVLWSLSEFVKLSVLIFVRPVCAPAGKANAMVNASKVLSRGNEQHGLQEPVNFIFILSFLRFFLTRDSHIAGVTRNIDLDRQESRLGNYTPIVEPVSM
jgi:hypothetical protein